MPEHTPLPSSLTVDPTDPRHSDRRRGEQRRVGRALWQGALGLLFGIVALGFALLAGWRVLSLERALEANRNADRLERSDHARLGTQLAALETHAREDAALLARLAPLPASVGALDERIGRIEARIEAPERAVARVEAAHLAELASHRLEFERDVHGAIVLLQAAGSRLEILTDSASVRARAQVARDVDALRAVPEPDVRTLSTRLSALEVTTRTLPMLGSIRREFVQTDTVSATEHGLARAWQKFTTSLQDLISIRRVSDAAVGLVSIEELNVRRHHLQTLLFAARLAALRADEADYTASVSGARDWLGQYFDGTSPATQAAAAELSDLAQRHVSPSIPDISGSVKLLRGRMP